MRRYNHFAIRNQLVDLDTVHQLLLTSQKENQASRSNYQFVGSAEDTGMS